MSKNYAQVYDCYRYLFIKIGHLSQIGEKDISNFQVENSGFSIDFSFSKTYLISLSKNFSRYQPGSRSVFQNRDRNCFFYRKNFSARFSIEISISRSYLFSYAKKFFRGIVQYLTRKIRSQYLNFLLNEKHSYLVIWMIIIIICWMTGTPSVLYSGFNVPAMCII